ncbi:MAG: O-antigen ligase family protein [Nitrospirae bacterium]|nr:O-antigen ligase family protein [Nitrospirota bacterium]
MKNKLKYIFLTAAALGFVILTVYNSFTPLLSALSVIVLCTVFAQPAIYRIALRFAISGFVAFIIILVIFKNETPSFQHNIERVNRLIHIDNEFKSAMGFSDRTVRWRATLDIIKERPLLGYGSGMKKFQNIVQWDKFMSKWKRDNPEIYDFYRPLKNQFYPPHNMFLEIAFQFGIIGLLSFLLFIYLYSYQLIKTTITLKDFNFSVILIGGTLLSFMIMGLMNNELGTTSGKFLFVVFGVGAGWMNNTKISG